MFLWAPLARRAKTSPMSRTLAYFFIIQFLLFLPTAYTQLKTEPYEMYARVHGGPQIKNFNRLDATWFNQISVDETADGYIRLINIPADKLVTAEFSQPTGMETEDNADTLVNPHVYALRVFQWADQPFDGIGTVDYVFGITPEYFLYRDTHASLAIPVNDVPAWVLREKDFGELFNYLALANNYFTRILLPVMSLMLMVFITSQVVFYWVVSWLFGQTRRITTYMTLRERFTVCVYASVPALVPGLLVGLMIPVFNVLIFEVVTLVVAFKVLGEY